MIRRQRRHPFCAVAPVNSCVLDEEANNDHLCGGGHVSCKEKLSHDSINEAEARKPFLKLGDA
jgi:hypothetical protein